MAIYTNVVGEFRQKIEDNLALNDVIDILIAQRLIDEKLYTEIWANQNNRVHHLLDVILKDAKRCAKFIDILGNISHMKQLSEAIKKDVDRIRTVIVLGGFPEFSLNYVVRNSIEWIELANLIQEKALELNIGIASTLVIHGLPGFGKSSLVNQVLQTKRFLEVSGGAMFWINLGEHLDTTTVINPLWNLYLNAVKLTNQVPLSHRPEDLSVLRDELKRVFLNEHLKNAYIVLDDVKSSAVLKVFKVHQKIIVTTQDKNIADDSGALFIKVTTGFTKKESLELLRKSLETDNLSTKESFANKIHDLCDGCPMLLNIIGSILRDSREEALSTDTIWRSIIDEIIKNDYLLHPTTEKVIHMIQMFVTCLSPEVQKCFHSLAVFPKHVNIRPEILMKLWNKSYYSVRQIMVELENKSLVVSFFNKDLKTYIYSIHSLVRTYLVEKAQVNIKQYHIKMISEYDDIINKSPDDPGANYIFGYYGYHAYHAELYDKFEKYFDLKFIENKIKRCGSADLLTDFDVYKDYITRKQPSLERKLKDFKKFVNSYSSHLHISPETNIIQFAFFCNNNYVYEEAKNIAINNPDQLYFKIDPYSGKHKNFPVLETRSNVTSTCFLNPKEVLVGTSNGAIEVKSFHQYQHKVRRFESHTDKVFNLQLSPDAKSFLSISEDHTVKLWRFAEDLDPQSPKCKQRNWKNLHLPDETNEQNKTFKMQDADFIISAAFPNDNSDEIVTASNKGRIVRWSTKTATVIKQSPEWGFQIPQVLYSHDSEQIIFSYDGKVFLYTRESLLYNGQFGRSDYFNDLILAPKLTNLRLIAAVGGQRLELWEYVLKKKMFQFETDSKITCSAVSGDHLVLGTDNYIYTYNFQSERTRQYKNDYGEPASLFILPDRIVFICLDKEKVQRCEFYLEPTEKPIVYDLTLFGCHWKESLPIYFIVTEENKIDIFNGYSTILSGVDEIQEQIQCASFSLCGNYIIFGTANGNVYFYNYKKRKTTHLKVCNEEIAFVKCLENDSDIVDSFDSNYVYGIIVAASATKIMLIDNNEINMVLNVKEPITDVFNLCNYLITVNIKGGLSCVTFTEKQTNSEIIEEQGVVAASVHKGKHLLAAACDEVGCYRVKIIKFISSGVVPRKMNDIKLHAKPTSMCFSSSGTFLAVGCEDGDIKVFNQSTDLQEILLLHKRSVEKLLFAPHFEPILVSVGDQIAWWNLQGLQKNEHEKENKSLNSNCEVDSVTKPNFSIWKNKQLHDTVPYLLTSTNLHGKQLKYISASKDFKAFLVVDIDGNIFKLDIICS